MLNSFYDKYIMTSTLKYSHNNFTILNIPFLIAPMEALTGIAQSQDIDFQKKVYEAVKKSVKERLIPQFELQLRNGKEKRTGICKRLLYRLGVGKPTNHHFERGNKRADILIENSPFAAALNGKTKLPADTFIRGVLAGLFSKLFEEDIDCVEVECAAQNSVRCVFILKPKTEFDFGNALVQQQLSHE